MILIAAFAALLPLLSQDEKSFDSPTKAGLAQDKPDEKKVRELLEKLDSNDVEVRTQAEADLSALGESAVPLLEKARSGASSETKARLESVIGEITLARRWLKDLSADEQEAMQAYSRLEQSLRNKSLDRKHAAKILNAAVASDAVSESIRRNLISTAERYHLVEIWPSLVRLMIREDQEAGYALSTLQRLKLPKEATDDILKAIPKVKNRNNLSQILELVIRIKPDREKLDPVLQALIDESDENSAYTIANMISSGRLPVSLKSAVRCWKGTGRLRQSVGRETILRIPPDEGIKEILDWIPSQDMEEAMLAAEYVARHKVRQGAVPLVEALQKQSSDERGGLTAPGTRRTYYMGANDPTQLRLRQVQALRALAPEELFKEWLAGGGPPSKLSLIGLIGELDLRSLAGEVVGALEEKDAAVRKAAARALATLPHPEAAAKLEARLKDDDASVCRAALQSLAQLRGPAATPIVLEQLRSGRPDVQAAAVEVLPTMNLDLVLEELTKESNLAGTMSRYALACLIVHHGEAVLHRVVARTGGKLSADELNAMVRLIQAARGQR